MPKQKFTFDQKVYIVVALPTMFFASYIVSAVVFFFALTFIVRRFQLESVDRMLGISPLLGDGTAVILTIAVALLIPTTIMTKRFFLGGWPKSQNQNQI